ncbi:MAG: YezD family protein [Thermomonas sp.]|uniref:DUF2292 domain-containing protein n=1 Tax=Thermomonas sp. TaxID=1971895 RepID=UPI0039E5133C
MKSNQLNAVSNAHATAEQVAEAEVLRAIRDTAFGTVEIIVHQSRIVQITRSEKVRFDKTA